jgi:hypothetical protein
VLLLGRDDWNHRQALEALGMVVELESAPAAFEWVVLVLAGGETPPSERLSEARRALVPGGWTWVASRSMAISPAKLGDLAAAAGLAQSEPAATDVDGGDPFVRGIYRRVENDTVA